MTSFSLSWYCLLQQLPYHNSSRADFPRQPLAQAAGDKPAHQLPLFTKQKYHSDSKSSFRFESIHVPPTKRAHWGSHPPNEHRMSHSLSSFRPELGRGDRSSCNAGSEVLPRAQQGRQDALGHHCGPATRGISQPSSPLMWQPCPYPVWCPGSMGSAWRHSLTAQGLPWSNSEGSLFDEVCQKRQFWWCLKGSDEFGVVACTQQSQCLMKLNTTSSTWYTATKVSPAL